MAERFTVERRVTDFRVRDGLTGAVVTGSKKLPKAEAEEIAARLNRSHGERGVRT